MKNTAKSTLITLGLSLFALPVSAELRVNGFANLTAGVINEDDTLFGYTEDIDFEPNSLFALQVSNKVNRKVTATAQIMSRGSSRYDAEFEWAYLTYEHDSNNSFTAGRFRLPVFMYSASLDVGYSYHWITAPQTVYEVSFNNINGLQYTHSDYVGDFEYLLQASFGSYEDEIAGGVNQGKDVALLSAQAIYKNLKGRVVVGRATSDFQSSLFEEQVEGFLENVGTAAGGQENIPAGVIALTEDLRIEDDEGTFVGVGFNYDNFTWFMGGEYTQVVLEDSFTPDDTAYYFTAGFRAGKWTPHFTIQAREGAGDIKFTDRVASLPDPFIAGATAFNTALQTTFFEDYSIASFGARYDFAPGVAIKGEVSFYDDKLESSPNLADEESTTLVNVSLNYVF